jgi:hypothetical protein
MARLFFGNEARECFDEFFSVVADAGLLEDDLA